MFEFNSFAQHVNEAQHDHVVEMGFEQDNLAKAVAINFDQVDLSQTMTAVCSGAARGGSSIIPYLLQNMGLPMGVFEADNYEDIDMLYNRQSIAALQGVIDKRNEQDRWGFKIPALRRGHFAFFDEALRNPVFLYIMRNPLHVALSVIDRAPEDAFTLNRKGFSNAIKGCIQSYQDFALFSRQTKSPCIFLPMETLKTAPVEAVALLNDRLCLNASSQKVAALAAQISVTGYKPRMAH